MNILADKRPRRNNYGQRIAHRAHGGKGANQAVAAARLGAEVTMVGCIGEDAYGHMIIDNLKENFINTDYIVTVPNATNF
ncbi:MAG: PfkB family carbohydrate kinase [Veillonella parvula]